jgi:cell division septation protein DedD
MQRDIRSRERKGFTVMSVTRNGQGWGVAKTVALGVVFLPLAIFGKKGDIFQVTYQLDTSKPRPTFKEQIINAYEEGKNRW